MCCDDRLNRQPIADNKWTADNPMMDATEIDRETSTYRDWRMSRRRLLQIGALATTGSFAAGAVARGDARAPEALAEFGYGAVSIASDAHEAQLRNTQSVLMSLSDDSLL